MASDNWRRYNKFPEYMGDGSMDMDDDTFNVALFLSTSNCATLTHDDYADLDNEHANQYGYVTKGQALDSVTWAESSGTITFDSANEVFTASGGSIICRFAVIFDDTMTSPVADGLVAFSLLDNTPLDVTVTTGNTLTISMHTSGILTLSGGQAAS